ncbi:MAG: hypothetical protein COV36_02215 [Alphaproteobacteria bacterium CG11_big_fil_rev_8_21_14_0_20_44_7]|nr:MAG: hypothetical protein COV36_02215 [Alphaproteobacteria bacterium CG11_big_fil_rev_8_21_14_0_20_44_7]
MINVQKVNIICMKWGTKYGPEYVNRLYSMVSRNLTVPHRFVCFTDDVKGLEKGIETFPMPEIYVPEKNRVSPWMKLSLLGETLGDLEGQSLFLDLDIVIIENIDCFFANPGKFCIIENWTQKGQGVGNSSVYRFEIGAHKDVLEYYTKNPEKVVAEYDNEQIFLSKMIGGQGDLSYWPAQWCKSFKRHCVPKGVLRFIKTPEIPSGAKIIVFHGHPHPDEAIKGAWPGAWYKHVKPTSWVADYWK